MGYLILKGQDASHDYYLDLHMLSNREIYIKIKQDNIVLLDTIFKKVGI
jgi:hypothetical protein